MNRSIRVGHVFGIEVRVDWSWLFILLLVTSNLAAVFTLAHPDWSARSRWSLAVLGALLFFASVLAHEVAHSLVARGRGIPVRSITLFLFGGVSDIQHEPTAPGAEFWMAIVGPLTSLVLGVLLLLLAGMGAASAQTPVMTTIGALSPLATMLAWLGSINISLGIFNMIPGFPLDGGRVLRSILWKVTGDLRRATRGASVVGQLIAWTMMVAGVSMAFGARIPLFGTGVSGGLWLAFIGWFLHGAAVQSYQQIVIQDVLEGVPVSRMMRLDPPGCRRNCSVGMLVREHIMGSDDQAFPVLEDGRILGLVTLDDVRRVPADEWDNTSVQAIMTPADKLVVVGPDDPADDAMRLLAAHSFRQLPVVQDGHLVGLLRRQDLIKWLQLHAEGIRGRPRTP